MNMLMDDSDAMNLDSHYINCNMMSYCLTVFERYGSLLKEFSGIDGIVDHDTVLNKINECVLEVENILEVDDGTFMASLYGLLSDLHELSDSICKRKNNRNCSKINLPATVKHEQKMSRESGNITSKLPDNVQSTIVIPKVNGLNNLAGLEETKKILKTMFLLPIKQPQLFVNKKTSNKLLLFGPPGTGKTLLAHAIAAEIKAVFHSISSSDILSSLVGGSEKMIKSLFQHGKENNGHTILFLDEIDAFCMKRSASEQQHSRRLITEIMCQMNNIEDCPNIFVIGATNCPWDLDSAILRRFQKRIYIPLPDANEREELLRFLSEQTPLSPYDSSEWKKLIELTEGLSSSDISNLVQNATDIPLMELQETRVWKKTEDDFYEPADREDNYCRIIWNRLEDLPPNSVRARPLRLYDFISAAQNYRPTVSAELIHKYNSFNKI